jgi:ketosteroid isomerase-like protein
MVHGLATSAPKPVVDAMRRSYAAWNDRDLDTLRELYTSDTEWDMSNIEGWPDSPVYHGHEGLEQALEDWYGAWSEMSAELLQVVIGRAIFVHGRMELRGRSGAIDSYEFAQVIETRDGLVARVCTYSDAAAARVAAGVLE